MPVTTQTGVISPPASQWNSSVALAQTDPRWISQSIGITLTGMLDSSLSVESSELGPSAFTAAEQGYVALDRPDGTALLVATSGTPVSTLLVAGDGAQDFAGPSGRSVALTGSNSVSQTYAGISPQCGRGIAGRDRASATASDRFGTLHAIGPGNIVADFATTVAAAVVSQAKTLRSVPGDQQLTRHPPENRSHSAE